MTWAHLDVAAGFRLALPIMPGGILPFSGLVPLARHFHEARRLLTFAHWKRDRLEGAGWR
jgi:hypothetical protein